MTSRLLVIVAAAACVLTLGGCGEKPVVTVYKQGTYQGKPDNLPWQGERFNGDKTEWEKAIHARNVGQNEYVRIENQ